MTFEVNMHYSPGWSITCAEAGCTRDWKFESGSLRRRVNNEPCGCRGIARRYAALRAPLRPWLTDPVTGVAVTVATFKPMAKHRLSTGMMAA
jgi:hypothetical protein